MLKELIAVSKFLEENNLKKESSQIGDLYFRYVQANDQANDQVRIEQPEGDPYEYKLEGGNFYTKKRDQNTEWKLVTNSAHKKAIEEKVFGINSQQASPKTAPESGPWYESIPGYDYARKKYDQYLSEDSSASGAKPAKPLPFKNIQEGNAFREWVNNNHGEWARSNSLDRSGSYNNQYVQKAWAQFGAEYEKFQKEEPKDIRSLIESIGIRWNSILKLISNLYAGPVAARFFARYLASALPGISFFAKDKITEKDFQEDELAAIAGGIKAAEKRGDVRKSGYTALHYKDWMNAGAVSTGVDTSNPNWQLEAPPPATVWGYKKNLPLPNTPEEIRINILSEGKDPRSPATRSEFGLDPLPTFTSGAGFAKLTFGDSDMYQQMAVTLGQARFKKEGDYYVLEDKYDFVGGAARKASSLAAAREAAESSGIGLDSVEKLVQVLEDKKLLKPFIFEIRIPTSMTA